jgi:hypothetical protein
MKALLILLSAFLIVSCEKQAAVTPITTVDTSIQIVKGAAIFYLREVGDPYYYGQGVVLMVSNDSIGKLTRIPSGIPDCGTMWGITIERNDGIYSYFAHTITGTYHEWSGQIRIVEGQCIKVPI